MGWVGVWEWESQNFCDKNFTGRVTDATVVWVIDKVQVRVWSVYDCGWVGGWMGEVGEGERE